MLTNYSAGCVSPDVGCISAFGFACHACTAVLALQPFHVQLVCVYIHVRMRRTTLNRKSSLAPQLTPVSLVCLQAICARVSYSAVVLHPFFFRSVL